MRILLTNDDGIHAPGILAMYDALTLGTKEHPGPFAGPDAEVVVVAPLTVQSATGHGITFHEPLMVREEKLRVPSDRRDAMVLAAAGVAVDGRPADCVKLAVSSVFPERFGAGVKPDLLVSGINAGANCGINVIYSGTVAAAIEGAFLGVPSVAISLRLARSTPRFDVAASRARAVLEQIFAAGGPRSHEVVNINLPATRDGGPEPESVKKLRATVAGGSSVPSRADASRQDRIDGAGRSDPLTMPLVRVCPMNTHGLIDNFERRTSPTGDVYFWAAGHGLDFHATEPGSDVDLLMRGLITVTPLSFDLTNHAGLAHWGRALGALGG